MKVKICGITDLDTALYAALQGADALGFVFAESKRKITPEKAKEIIEKLPEHILKVGVFVNESIEMIEKIAGQTGLTAIQLHGDESPRYYESLALPIIKALSVESAHDLLKVHEHDCTYVLLDSPKGKYRGGNGVKFDWTLLSELDSKGKKVILAGGLNSENVKAAIQLARPYMVDVSSGVETAGKKDPEKIKQFISEAKTALKEEVK